MADELTGQDILKALQGINTSLQLLQDNAIHERGRIDQLTAQQEAADQQPENLSLACEAGTNEVMTGAIRKATVSTDKAAKKLVSKLDGTSDGSITVTRASTPRS